MSEEKSIVITAVVGSELNTASAGLLGAGQRLAREMNSEHIVIVCGGTDSPLVAKLSESADRVIAIESAELTSGHPEVWLNTIASIGTEEKPRAIILGNDILSQEITPRLAHRLGGASIGDVQALSANGGSLIVTRSVYGGKAVAEIELTAVPAVVWVRAQSMDPADANTTPGEIVAGNVDESIAARTQLVETHEEAAEGERLEDAQIIVSGGRGMGGPEPFEDLVALAKVLKAQNSASRAACDLGWVPHSWQVGQTGKKVAPQLYLAVAISGASQHMMGIADSKAIAAINTDPDAPIFKHCQFGLVEDYKQVIGPLKEKLAELLK
jgi:electron transfer flavoprotein alpha subunit